MHTLHYIFDPLCGWCYAAAPLISAACSIPNLSIVPHSGGMMTGANRRTITGQWRDYVIPHDRRIAQMTGQPFGAAYFDGLLYDTSAVMDSAPPTTAILAAEKMAGRGLGMLHRVQHAHYVEGRRIADMDVLLELAQEMVLERSAFSETFARLAGGPTDQHFIESRQLLARCGGQGFPTLALERANGKLERLDMSNWLGRAEEWREHLLSQLPSSEKEG